MDAALGNAACTALTPLHGQRNGLRRRCIRSSSPASLLGIIIAKDQMVGATAELASNTRRSWRTKIENRQFEDYELYTTVELMLATPVEENPAGDEEDDEVLASLAHFIMVHY